MVNVLPLESTTILAGVGYYFKYRPANAPDNNTIISCTLPNSQKEVVYSFFSNN